MNTEHVKKVAVVQSNYIPWKGYFDMINMSDEFILFDDVQFTKRDWRNRNKIKTKDGVLWLTIPVISKDRYFQKINETRISETNWGAKHWQTLQSSYGKARCFKEYRDTFENLYLGTRKEEFLSKVNYSFIKAVNAILGIKTRISWAGDYELVEGKTERLLHLCKQAGAAEYISGPAAKDYLDEALFRKENIKVTWMDYTGYKPYTQLWGEFVHEVSIIDLIFNEGPDAVKFMKTFHTD